MTIDDLKKVLEGSDLGAILPDLNAIVDKMASIMRIALLAGPLILLALGLLYLFASPKEANYKFGYRCYFGMGSVYAWRYSQRLAGILFIVVGLILTLLMFSVTGKFQDMDTMEMLWKALKMGILEAVVIILTRLTINFVVAFYFDAKGRLRRKPKKQSAAVSEKDVFESLTPAAKSDDIPEEDVEIPEEEIQPPEPEEEADTTEAPEEAEKIET